MPKQLDKVIEAIDRLQDLLDGLNNPGGDWEDSWPDDDDMWEVLEACEDVINARKGLKIVQRSQQ